MIQGGWVFVTPAYVVTIGGLAVLALVAFVRARHWAKKARELESRK